MDVFGNLLGNVESKQRNRGNRRRLGAENGLPKAEHLETCIHRRIHLRPVPASLGANAQQGTAGFRAFREQQASHPFEKNAAGQFSRPLHLEEPGEFHRLQNVRNILPSALPGCFRHYAPPALEPSFKPLGGDTDVREAGCEGNELICAQLGSLLEHPLEAVGFDEGHR